MKKAGDVLGILELKTKDIPDFKHTKIKMYRLSHLKLIQHWQPHFNLKKLYDVSPPKRFNAYHFIIISLRKYMNELEKRLQ